MSVCDQQNEACATPTRRAALIGLGASALTLPAYARGRKDAQVIVIGAGIAGLETALRLEAAGLDVLVLEGSSRIGGRLQTWTDLPGKPNAGGVQIGASYQRLRARAAGLGVALIPEPTTPRPSRLAIGDTLLEPGQWAGSPLNPFPSAYKATLPAAALFATAARANPLAIKTDWMGPKGLAADVSADRFLANLDFNAAARALIDVGLNANRLDTYSMLNVWRTLTLYAADRAAGTGSSMIEGGSQALPEAMAKALKRPVMIGQMAQSISVRSNGAEVQVGGRRLRADAIVAALPFPALRRLRVRAPLSVETTQAIDGLPYTQIIQAVLEPATRFWEADGLPIDMWTDGPLERLFSIRDNGADTGQIMLWLNGTGASALDRPLSGGGLPPVLSARLKALRPASDGQFKLVRVQHWTASNPLAGGAYMHWAPGQVGRWAGKMGLPAGRLFFAGEHLGLVHTGMEAAFESAETTSQSVLQALGRL